MGDASNNNTIPAPYVYSASQEFIGNDGKWSTFIVRVGASSQNFQVLPSSTTGEVVVPIVDGCQKMKDVPRCGPSRGAYDFQGKQSQGFVVNASSSWNNIGIYGMHAREDLNYSANAIYGLDKVGLMIENSGGPVMDKVVVGAVAKPQIWVGMIGLGQKPANFSEFANPQTAIIPMLKEQKKIPSKSFGYTAGAVYKRPSVLASLVLGGYDQSRFVPNNISFPFDPDDDKSVSLSIQSMVAQGTFSSSTNLLGPSDTPTYVNIDYTVPHMWLPKSVCDLFEQAFHLEYDNSTDLYLVNDTTHNELTQKNPTVTIGLGATVDPAQRVNIVLPYSAFDLQASQPYYPNATNYFPLRRAQNQSMYTLGRTFMQEAYLRVDYERGNFSVHQALFPSTNEKQVIVPINATDAPKPVEKIEEKHGLSGGAVAGIVISVIIALALLAFAAFWFLKKRKGPQVATQEQSREIDLSTGQETYPDDKRYLRDNEAAFEVDGSGPAVPGSASARSFEFEKDGKVISELQDPGFTPVELNAHTYYELSGGEVYSSKSDKKS